MAGRVRVDGAVAPKPGTAVAEDAALSVERAAEHVSRGGTKLANALEAFGVDVAGARALDVGASTGGFTDCLLQAGAASVIALDVGYGQLDWRLRQDPRVVVMERVNARELEAFSLPFEPSLITVDASFISLAKLIGPVAAAAGQRLDLLALVKPQFELGPERVGRGGVVRDSEARRDAIRAVAEIAAGEGLLLRGMTSSRLPGPKGNRETFVWCSRDGDAVDLEQALRGVSA